jgi:threonine/homoserine/homoserine lactone efflux protein
MMLDLPLLLAFLVAISILTITPGLDTAMVLRAAATEDSKSGGMVAIGIALGCLLWAGAVSFGLGALLQASEFAYSILKWAGGAYLVWLGVSLLLAPRSTVIASPDLPNWSKASALRRGLLTNVLNPKVGVFYVTFLPQFVPSGASIAVYIFLLAAIHVLLALLWFGVLIMATVPLSNALRKPKVVKWLDRLTGSIFIGFGLKLAASKT